MLALAAGGGLDVGVVLCCCCCPPPISDCRRESTLLPVLDVGDMCDAEALLMVRPNADCVLWRGVNSRLLAVVLGMRDCFQMLPERDVARPVASGL